ncbi:DNA helicase Pif1 like protein [Lentinula aff. lateritia]|uniref:DNA helicase Pif1 like protein n=1 Tax=Lentinula aff. lateritia TaxID=2804960 RepID=A0ACC1TG95_9AGAR|nr:DNA helicase Pif1 like protein [Lentinula aff. lateritia]
MHPCLLNTAGTGKTLIYKTLCYMLQDISKIVLCWASSGLAALLLPKGHTVHSTFKIPIDIFKGRTYSIKKNSELAELLQKVSLIIWDEVPMQN